MLMLLNQEHVDVSAQQETRGFAKLKSGGSPIFTIL